MAAPKKVDYASIEPAWRAGLLSPLQLAAQYTATTGVSVSHTAIIKHFKKLGAPRDLAAKVKAKADAMVLQAMVTGKVSAETKKPDSQIVNDNAMVVAGVQLAHRTDIDKHRKLAMKLLAELEVITDKPELFHELGDLLRKPDENGQDRLNDLYRRVLELPSRIKGMKDLSEVLERLIGLESRVFGIVGAGPETQKPPPGAELDPADTYRWMAGVRGVIFEAIIKGSP